MNPKILKHVIVSGSKVFIADTLTVHDILPNLAAILHVPQMVQMGEDTFKISLSYDGIKGFDFTGGGRGDRKPLWWDLHHLGYYVMTFVSADKAGKGAQWLDKAFVILNRLKAVRELPKDYILQDRLAPVLERIKIFFMSADKYAEYGLRHRRGILLYGKPGVGKTAFISAVIDLYPEAQVSSDLQSDAHNADNGKKIVFLNEIEDQFDKPGYRSRGSMLTNLENVSDNTLVLGTTNKPHELDNAFYNRPGRFEECVKVEPPTQGELQEFFKRKQCFEVDGIIFKHGLTFAHATEVVYRIKIACEDPAMALAEVMKNDKKEELNVEDRTAVGF